jgi:membrane-associated progesterone receptor component
VAILTAVTVGYIMTTRAILPTHTVMDSAADAGKEEEEEASSPPDQPRNFTTAQLRHFDGTLVESKFDTEPKPVYLAVHGIVFDVSKGRDFYGPGGPYETFAGRECGAALAKMSFDEIYLDDPELCETLNFGEKAALDDWIQKFTHYRAYPILGRLITDQKLPNPDRVITLQELAAQNGVIKNNILPDGYAAPSIYVAVDGLVFDMSFGGVSFYGPGGPYEVLAGRDASRALAVMKLDEAANGNTDLSDLTEKQLQTMKDWAKTFRDKKKYPIVGKFLQEQRQ